LWLAQLAACVCLLFDVHRAVANSVSGRPDALYAIRR
jgi:hypothetical protein